MRTYCNGNWFTKPNLPPGPPNHQDRDYLFICQGLAISGGFHGPPSKLSVWRDRYSEANRTSPGRFSNHKPKPGHRMLSKFSNVQSQPGSPMIDHSPLSWFIKDIDIDDRDSGRSSFLFSSSQPRSGLVRTQSRHDSHFALGSTPLLAGNAEHGWPDFKYISTIGHCPSFSFGWFIISDANPLLAEHVVRWWRRFSVFDFVSPRPTFSVWLRSSLASVHPPVGYPQFILVFAIGWIHSVGIAFTVWVDGHEYAQ